MLTYLEELGTLGRVTWRNMDVSRLLRFLRGLKFGLAHVNGGKKTESVKAGHVGLDGWVFWMHSKIGGASINRMRRHVADCSLSREKWSTAAWEIVLLEQQ